VGASLGLAEALKADFFQHPLRRPVREVGLCADLASPVRPAKRGEQPHCVRRAEEANTADHQATRAFHDLMMSPHERQAVASARCSRPAITTSPALRSAARKGSNL
jgi:hypothetical protein